MTIIPLNEKERGYMKIKSKLVISFCIVIFIPIILATFTFVGFYQVQKKSIEQAYGIEDADAYSLNSSIQLLNRITEDSFESILDYTKNSPDKLEDTSFLNILNNQLGKQYSYVVVKKNNEVIYNGGTSNDELIADLPEFGTINNGDTMAAYLDSKNRVLVKRIDFHFGDDSLGTVFLITATQDVIPEIKHFIIELLVAIVVILLFTAVLMIIWIYRSLITPIKQLQKAAENIKDGNLDFELYASGDDEIAELVNTFEQMRMRLKSNATEKINNEKENRVLISNIAHDLKTPITAVKGYSEGILDGVANTPEKVDKYVRTIYNKANEMDMLINELTLYSKIDTNRIPYNFAKINVTDYFSDCVEEIGLDLESKGIGLAYYNYADENTIIIADPEQLRRVINNIVGNSVKYMGRQNGFINIRIKDVGDFIQIEIEDNGRGIAQKDIPYIFDRFYRGDASRNSATGGSGIGLSIVRKIIEDHGGKIWATSKEGTGTIMYFVIRKYIEEVKEIVNE